MRPDEIRPGGLVAGKYRIRTILGRGHGVLVEAFNTEFDQRVAIRLLLAGQTDDKELERFRRESRTLAKLESEHVARIIDVGTAPDGTFYLVRQFLEGTDLATHVRSRGPLPLQEAVLLVLQAAEAMSETHGHGIIFREMAPQNLFVTQRVGGAPLLKIIDFGTAKLMRDVAAPTAGEMTATTMLGLSAYSSPEIVRKMKNVDVRADVWSLGAILYFLLTARPPFEGEMAMLMLQIAKEDPRPVTELRRDLPPEIEQILGWAMAKDVDGRFANVHAFAHALRPFTTAEGQVLIDRIGQITHAAKQRKKTGSVPPPPVAQPAPPARRIQDDESVTRIQSSAVAVGDQPLERTMYLAQDYVPPSPGPLPNPPPPPGATATPFPGAGGAGGGAMFGGAASGMGGSVLGPSQALEPARAPAPSWSGAGRNEPATPPGGALSAGSSAMSFGAPEAVPPKKNRGVLIGGLAAAAVLVPVILVVLLMRGGDKKEGAEGAEANAPVAVAAPSANSAAEAPAAPAPTAEPAPAPSSEPVAAATAPSEPGTTPTKATTPAAGGGGTAPASGPSGGGATPKPTATPTPTATSGGGKTPIPTPTTTAAPSGGGNGTLVAVAVGGACAFSVNGASKGTTSTLKVSMAPGTYSVSCKPASGATKSRSVTIKSGETAMAMFKLQ
jgi:serine/threonine-protein kinase